MVLRLPHSDYINIWFSRRLEKTEVTVGKPLGGELTEQKQASKQKQRNYPLGMG